MCVRGRACAHRRSCLRTDSGRGRMRQPRSVKLLLLIRPRRWTKSNHYPSDSLIHTHDSISLISLLIIAVAGGVPITRASLITCSTLWRLAPNNQGWKLEWDGWLTFVLLIAFSLGAFKSPALSFLCLANIAVAITKGINVKEKVSRCEKLTEARRREGSSPKDTPRISNFSEGLNLMREERHKYGFDQRHD